MLALKGPHGLIEMRKHLGWYLKGFDGRPRNPPARHQRRDLDDIEALLAAVLAAGAATPVAA